MNVLTDPEMINSKNKPELTDVQSPAGENRGHLNRLDDIQQAVGILLEYTVEKSDFDIKDDFLKQVIPLLRKTKEELTESEEVCLWSAYNLLSNLAYPVTVESLTIAKEIHYSGVEAQDCARTGNGKNGLLMMIDKCRRELKYTLYITSVLVFLFFIFQGYTIVLGEDVKIIKEVETNYEAVQQRIDDIRLTNMAIAENDPLLIQLENKKRSIETRAEALNHLPILTSYICKKVNGFEAHIHCLDGTARFGLLVFSSHILPFLLGFLGAMAALVRQSLEGLENKSFTQGWSGRLYLRLFLGGLLGEISGIIFTPSLNELEALKISLVFIAFLMGYSTELAFSVFDRAIESAKEAIKPSPKSLDTLNKPRTDAESVE